MNEMVERVAKAIAVIDNDLSNWREWLPHARGAIQAMRELTDEMIDAVGSEAGPALTDNWQRMIDASLGFGSYDTCLMASNSPIPSQT